MRSADALTHSPYSGTISLYVPAVSFNLSSLNEVEVLRLVSAQYGSSIGGVSMSIQVFLHS